MVRALKSVILNTFWSANLYIIFKVLLYNPIDQPRMKESGLPVMIGHQTSFRIIARSFEALPTIRNIHRTKRQCIFSDEQELLFYRYYTRRNCEAECESLFFLRVCNCIPYYLPLVHPNASICDVINFECLNSAESQIFDVRTSQCKELCLTSCHDLIFFPDAFTTPLSHKKVNDQSTYLKNLSSDYIRKNLAVVNFFHTDNYFRSSVRTSYTGPTEYMGIILFTFKVNSPLTEWKNLFFCLIHTCPHTCRIYLLIPEVVLDMLE